MIARSEWHDPSPDRRASFLSALLAILALGASCSPERPELVPMPPDSSVPESIQTPAAAPIQRANCQTAVGAGPFPIAIEAEPAATLPCWAVGTHQQVQLVNQTTEALELGVGGTVIPVGPGEQVVTGQAGVTFTTGPNEIVVGPQPMAAVWVVDPAENSLTGSQIGLTSIGAIELGQDPAEVTAASGGVVAASGAACHQTSLQDDPYSPLLTFRDGQLVVVQVFTPGLATRSGVAIGTPEIDVVATYGDQLEEVPHPSGDPARKLLVFVPIDVDDQIYRLVFDLRDGLVEAIRFGAAEIVANQPGC